VGGIQVQREMTLRSTLTCPAGGRSSLPTSGRLPEGAHIWILLFSVKHRRGLRTIISREHHVHAVNSARKYANGRLQPDQRSALKSRAHCNHLPVYL